MSAANQMNKQDISKLRAASPQAIQVSLQELSAHFLHDRWLNPRNRYRRDTIENIKQDSLGSSRIATNRKRDLARYIAASAILHCSDGWTILGRALTSHVYNDVHTTRHLAYYAELRAVMSLLATQGIGVFASRHFIVEKDFNCSRIGKGSGTHTLAWQAFSQWSKQSVAPDLILRVISPFGIQLKDWYSVFASSQGLPNHFMQQRLEAWGIDLRRLSKDHDARNESSYRPTQLSLGKDLSASESIQFIARIWRAVEPSMAAFGHLDRALLIRDLASLYVSTSGRMNWRAFDRKMRRSVADLGLNGNKYIDAWLDNIPKNKRELEELISSEALKKYHPALKADHKPILCRALILLRIATACVADTLKRSAIDRSHLAFWWRDFGETRGLWAPGNQPADFNDLWLDIDEEVSTIESLTSNAGSNGFPNYYHEILSHDRSRPPEQRIGLPVLGSCERIALWGLGL